MKFDKELGKERLGNFFGGIKNKILQWKEDIQDYRDSEPERIEAQITKMDAQIKLEERKVKLNKLKEKVKGGKSEDTILGALSQQKIYAEDSATGFTNHLQGKKKKVKENDLDTGYSGIGKGMFGG